MNGRAMKLHWDFEISFLFTCGLNPKNYEKKGRHCLAARFLVGHGKINPKILE